MKNHIYHILYSIMVVLFVGILIWLTCVTQYVIIGKGLHESSFFACKNFGRMEDNMGKENIIGTIFFSK